MDRDIEQKLWELGDTGVLVEDDVLGIVERIRAMDPGRLDVQFLDPNQFPDLTDAPYRIIERCNDGIPRVVFTCWTLDERVINRLRASDSMRNDILANLDAVNQLARDTQKRRWEEVRLEEQDIIKHIMASPKGSYTFKDSDGGVHKVQDSPG